MKFVITRRTFSPTRDLFFYAGEIRFVMIRPDYNRYGVVSLRNADGIRTWATIGCQQ